MPPASDQLEVIYPRGWMRASPDLVRGPTPVQTALARVRLPVGSAGLRGRRDRHRRARRRTRAGAADAGAPAAERVRHGRVLRAVRDLPARSPRARRPAAVEPVRVLGPALRSRSAVGRVLPAGARVLRPVRAGHRAWCCSSPSTTCWRRSRRMPSRASPAPGAWEPSMPGSPTASRATCWRARRRSGC